MSEIKVSVIIPVFNAEKWLRECIASVSSQTLKEIEIICVDDGSTDGSLEILEHLKEKDNRIKIISQGNAGAGAARNRGLDAARGEYLSFLDADDLFEPDMLLKTYVHSKSTDADVCIFKWDMLNPEGQKFGEFGCVDYLLPDKEVFNIKDIQKDFFGMTNPPSWNKLFKKAFIAENDIRFQELPRVDDLLFTYKALMIAKKITVFDDVLMHYRIGNAGSQSSNMESKWHCLHEALNAVKEEAIKNDLYNEKDFLNMVVRNVLFVLDSINDKNAYEAFINEIRNTWIKTLISNYNNKSSFYIPAEYERFQAMLTGSVDEYTFCELKRVQKSEAELWQKNLILDNENKRIKASYNEISSLKNHIRHYVKKKLNRKKTDNKNIEAISPDEQKKLAYYNKLYSECDFGFIDDVKKRITDIPDSNGSRYYKKLPYTIGIVCDSWIYNSYEGSADFIYITYENYKKHLKTLDAFIVYTTWYGLNDEWIDLNTPLSESAGKLSEIILEYKENSIKTVFISVEDPPYYDRFLYIAKQCDYIFTSESEMIENYHRDCGNQNVYIRPFLINPLLHNPIGCMHALAKEGAIFAGSWYSQHPERNKDIEMMLDGVLEAGMPLHIIDRHFYHKNLDVAFPEKYIKYISPSIEYKDLQKVYKLFNYAININSVKDSKTMFANRVMEMQATGNMLLSNYSKGINILFPNVKLYHTKEEIKNDVLNMSDLDVLVLRMEGVRNMMTGYTSYDAVAGIIKTIGMKLPEKLKQTILVVTDAVTEEISSMYSSQTYEYKHIVTCDEFINMEISEYVAISFWNNNYTYGQHYLEDMFNGFKYTDSNYITKDAYFNGDDIIKGTMHDYVSSMPDKYRSMFWSRSFRKEQLLAFNGASVLENGYSIDPLGLTSAIVI